MLFTWVPQLGRHILWLSFKSWVYIAAMMCLVWFLPLIATAILTGLSIAVPKQMVWIFNIYPYVAVLTCIFLWIDHERVHQRWFAKRTPVVEPASLRHTLEHISRLARRDRPPAIVMLYDTTLNPDAMSVSTAFTTGDILSATRAIIQQCTEREIRAFYAHEIAHLKHLDIPVQHFVITGFWMMLFATFMAFLWMCLGGLLGDEPAHTAAWMFVFVSFFGMYCLYLLLAAAHSRCREYLADAGAVALTGWSDRDACISMVLKIAHTISQKNPALLFGEDVGFYTLEFHPTLADRAKALHVVYTFLPSDTVAFKKM